MKNKFIWILVVVLLVIAVGCQPVGGITGALPRQQATWTDILALFVPLIAVGIMQLGWSKEVNSLIALAVTVGVALLDAWYFGALNDLTNLVQTVFDVLVTAFVTYKTIWGPLGIVDWWAEKTTLQRFKMPLTAKPTGLPW